MIGFFSKIIIMQGVALFAWLEQDKTHSMSTDNVILKENKRKDSGWIHALYVKGPGFNPSEKGGSKGFREGILQDWCQNWEGHLLADFLPHLDS